MSDGQIVLVAAKVVFDGFLFRTARDNVVVEFAPPRKKKKKTGLKKIIKFFSLPLRNFISFSD